MYQSEQSDCDFYDYADGQISLSCEQWKDILQDASLVSQKDISFLLLIYLSDNHAATCTDLGKQMNKHPTSFIAPAVGMGKRITRAYSLPVLYRPSGQQFCWPVLFLGKHLSNDLFAWKLRPELADAFRELYAPLIRQEQEARYREEERLSVQVSDDELRKMALQRSGRKTRTVTAVRYVRDPYISEWAKRRANGVCDLCGQAAPFRDADGRPYLEAHHIVWLSKNGNDSIDNVAALCPNCHRKMHVLDDAQDRQILTDRIREYLRTDTKEK